MPLIVPAALVVLFEELFWDQLQAAIAWIARWPPLARLEAWIAGRDRWTILALFLVPLAGLFPIKVAALWLMGSGHFALGLGVLALAKVIGTALGARLFALGRERLLTIKGFAWTYRGVLWLRGAVHVFLARIGATALLARVKTLARAAKAACAARAGAGRGWWTRRVLAFKRRLAERRA